MDFGAARALLDTRIAAAGVVTIWPNPIRTGQSINMLREAVPKGKRLVEAIGLLTSMHE